MTKPYRCREQPGIHQYTWAFEVQPVDDGVNYVARFDICTTDMFQWCSEQFGDRWNGRWAQQPRVYSDGMRWEYFFFSLEDDAFAFKMRWG